MCVCLCVAQSFGECVLIALDCGQADLSKALELNPQYTFASEELAKCKRFSILGK